MKRYFCILSLCIFIISCNQNQTEKDYIKNLEEKNKALEKELQEAKSNPSTKNTSKGKKQETEISKDFFTIGSTEDEVIVVMGDPTSYMITAPEAKKFLYGMSTVYFYKGKVISYDNLDENLKVKVKR